MTHPITSIERSVVFAALFALVSAAVSGQCTVPGEHPTIQDAIDDWACADITLSPGAHEESIVIYRSLDLLGDESGGSVFEGGITVLGNTTAAFLGDLAVASGCDVPVDVTDGAEVQAFGLDVTPSSSSPCPEAPPLPGDGSTFGEDVLIRDGVTTEPELGVAASGTSLHVWTEFDEILWRALDRDGTPLGPASQLNTTAGNDQRVSNIGVQPDGSFYAVWLSDEGADWRIRGRYHDGVALEMFDGLVSDLETTDTMRKTAVAPLTGGGFVAVWEGQESHEDDTSVASIQGQLISSSGEVSPHPQFQVNSYTNSWQLDADVTPLPDGGFYVVWESSGSDGDDNSGYSIQGRRFDAVGNPAGPDQQINTTTAGQQWKARVATNGQGEMLVVWTSSEAGNGGDFDVVRARWLDAAGTPLGDDFVVSVRDDHDQREPDVAGGTSYFVVTWFRYFDPLDGDDHDVDARIVTAPDDFTSVPFRVNTYEPGNQSVPAVSASGDSVMISWMGANDFGAHHLSLVGRAVTLDSTCLFCDGFESGDTSAWSSTVP